MKNSTSIVQPTFIINAGEIISTENTDHKLYNFCKLYTHKIAQLHDTKINLELTKQAVVRARAQQKSHRPTPPNHKLVTG